jgi:hypothetical protein
VAGAECVSAGGQDRLQIGPHPTELLVGRGERGYEAGRPEGGQRRHQESGLARLAMHCLAQTPPQLLERPGLSLVCIGDREPDHQLLLGFRERPPRAGTRRQQRLEGADQTRPVVLIPQDPGAKPPLRRIGASLEQGKRRLLPVRRRQRPRAQQTPLPA